MKKTAAAGTTGTRIVAFQGGVEQTDGTVQSGVEFELHGSGFAPSELGVTTSQAKVCLTGQVCVRSPVDANGSFVQAWTLYGTGTYDVHVYQGTSPSDPPLVYSGELVVE